MNFKTVNFKIYKIQIITFIAAKFFVANTAVNVWSKNSVMSTVQDSLTRQQFSMIMSSLLQSLRIACNFPVSESESSIITVHCSHSTVASV